MRKALGPIIAIGTTLTSGTDCCRLQGGGPHDKSTPVQADRITEREAAGSAKDR